MTYKKHLTNLLVSVLAIFSLACSDTTKQNDAKTEPTSKESKVVMKTLDVKGMTCEGCEGTIVNYVTKIDGVVSSKASHVKESVIVKYDESKTTIEEIMKTISSTGYKVNGLKEETTKP